MSSSAVALYISFIYIFLLSLDILCGVHNLIMCSFALLECWAVVQGWDVLRFSQGNPPKGLIKLLSNVMQSRLASRVKTFKRNHKKMYLWFICVNAIEQKKNNTFIKIYSHVDALKVFGWSGVTRATHLFLVQHTHKSMHGWLSSTHKGRILLLRILLRTWLKEKQHRPAC